jgi:transcriptional regulator with XRE-family HTH domain
VPHETLPATWPSKTATCAGPGFEIAGARESTALAANLGTEARHGRKAAQLTQEVLARRVGIKRTRYGELERGEGASAPLSLWVGVGQAIGRPLAVSFTRSLAAPPRDAGHLALQELVLGLAQRNGYDRHFELPTRPANPALSVDVLLRLDQHRLLVIIEVWNRLEDLGAAVRVTHRKEGEAEALAVVAGGEGRPYGVASCWIMRASRANRELVRRYPAIFRAEFRASSRAWVAALEDGGGPPRDRGIVWADPQAGLTALNLRRSS